LVLELALELALALVLVLVLVPGLQLVAARGQQRRLERAQVRPQVSLQAWLPLR